MVRLGSAQWVFLALGLVAVLSHPTEAGTRRTRFEIKEPTEFTTELGPVVAAPGTVMVYWDQNGPVQITKAPLAAATLAKDATLVGIKLKTESHLEFGDPKESEFSLRVFCPEDIDLGDAVFSKMAEVPVGRSRQFVNPVTVWKKKDEVRVKGHLKKAAIIDGIPVRANRAPEEYGVSGATRLSLEESTVATVDGKTLRLIAGYLAKDFEYEPRDPKKQAKKVSMKEGDYLYFGNPNRDQPSKEFIVGFPNERRVEISETLTLSAIHHIGYGTETGRPTWVKLSQNQTVHGAIAKKETDVHFYPTGEVKEIFVTKGQVARGIPVVDESAVTFWPNGAVQIVLTRDEAIPKRLGMDESPSLFKLGLNPEGAIRLVDPIRSTVVRINDKPHFLSVYYRIDGKAGSEKVSKKIEIDNDLERTRAAAKDPIVWDFARPPLTESVIEFLRTN